MELSKFDFSNIEENMKPFELIVAIYEVRDTQSEKNNIFNKIIVNEKLLNMIDTINFIYVRNGLEPTTIIKKVGYLNDLEVYLDPNRENNNITFINDQKETYELEIIF